MICCDCDKLAPWTAEIHTWWSFLLTQKLWKLRSSGPCTRETKIVLCAWVDCVRCGVLVCHSFLCPYAHSICQDSKNWHDSRERSGLSLAFERLSIRIHSTLLIDVIWRLWCNVPVAVLQKHNPDLSFPGIQHRVWREASKLRLTSTCTSIIASRLSLHSHWRISFWFVSFQSLNLWTICELKNCTTCAAWCWKKGNTRSSGHFTGTWSQPLNHPLWNWSWSWSKWS